MDRVVQLPVAACGDPMTVRPAKENSMGAVPKRGCGAWCSRCTTRIALIERRC
jgi:hypothetical protein